MEESNYDVTSGHCEEEPAAPHPCTIRRDTTVKSVAFRVDGDDEQRHQASATVEDNSMTDTGTFTSSGKAQGEFFPGLHPMVFGCMGQTSFPRIWFLRIVANPYPFCI